MDESSPIKPTMVVTTTEEVPISSSDTKPIEDDDDDDDDDDSPEESSWTFYMQDFECGGGSDNINSSFSSSGLMFDETSNNSHNNNSSSLVSDAASSSAGRNFAGISNKVVAVPPKFPSERSNNYYNVQKLSFRRPREAAAGFNLDRDLEDTASSPVNSPKISCMNQLTLKQNERNNNLQVLTSPMVDTNSGNNHNMDCSELKKKGLCLVPVSVMAKYFG